MKKEYFYIREEWIMRGLFSGIERYDETDTLANIIKASSKKIAIRKVKKWIKEWIETWKENAEDNEYTFKRYDTDYKTYAKLWIKKEDATDTFKLKVIPIKERRRGK